MPFYLTIHGHFYQPPRENPWLEAIEVQDSAYPYHDWNERVSAEAYRPNATSRILGTEGKIAEIVNNYCRISFNFGPTLLDWMEKQTPDVYQAVLEADRDSISRFSGHGSALAQAYNHIILPLANRRDKVTQVVWGAEDFRRRFGRDPEGMWLPETAVDIESLEVLAEQGIKFTILAPRQAGKVRRLSVAQAGSGDIPVADNINNEGDRKVAAPRSPIAADWIDVSGERVDSRRPYWVRLPSGRRIAVFFYNGELARAVAFEGLLKDGARFADRCSSPFDWGSPEPQLSHIATDGETYGHHHRFGDMALAFALRKMEAEGRVQLTNYGEFLELHPPTWEAEVIEQTAWSCAHGVERWRSDCGCVTGEHPGWNQAWRRPLREAFNYLRDEIGRLLEDYGKRLLKDPWAARDDYIRVMLDRSPESLAGFVAEQGAGELDGDGVTQVMMMMEMQRHLLLMFTSCGWFFDDLAGIETVQDLAYAARAVQLARDLFGDSLEERFLGMLQEARSNKPAMGDGRQIYELFVRSTMVDQPKVCAHYALTGLFENNPPVMRLYQYEVERLNGRTFEAGRAKLAIGRVRVASMVTLKSDELCYAALHFGDHNLSCGVRFYDGDDAYKETFRDLSESFGRADIAGVIRQLDRHFPGKVFALKSLFRDGQRKMLERIMSQTLDDAEGLYRELHEDHTPLMRFLTDLRAPVPKAFTTAAEFVLNLDLRRKCEEDDLDIDGISDKLEEAAAWKIELDKAGLGYALTQTISRLAGRFELDPEDEQLLGFLFDAVELASKAPLEVNLWNAQNAVYRVAQREVGKWKSGKATALTERWLGLFRRTAELLRVAV